MPKPFRIFLSFFDYRTDNTLFIMTAHRAQLAPNQRLMMLFAVLSRPVNNELTRLKGLHTRIPIIIPIMGRVPRVYIAEEGNCVEVHPCAEEEDCVGMGEVSRFQRSLWSPGKGLGLMENQVEKKVEDEIDTTFSG